MKHITKDEALTELCSRKGRGEHIDQRLEDAIRSCKALFLLALEDEGSFLSLIWQAHRHTRILTPPDQPRTLRDVVRRMGERTFAEFCDQAVIPPCSYNPRWFDKCRDIDASFDPQRFGRLALVIPTCGELKGTPNGLLYVYDGVHKTLVLAKRLLSGQSKYWPVDALLILPRPRC